MSGTNPFRRREAPAASRPQPDAHHAASDAVERAGMRFPPIDTVPKSSKTKTVRIVSPHYSRSKDTYGIHGASSPPPQDFSALSPVETDSPSSAEGPSPVDPFSGQSDETATQDDEDLLRRNTVVNATLDISHSPSELKSSLNAFGGAPALRFGGDASTNDSQDDPGRLASGPDAGRPRYDVDDFKRLLLTGQKLQTDKGMAGTSPGPVQGLQIGGSTVNTHASSVSPQSFFEVHADVRAESPRTSTDASPSDEERHALVQPLSSPNLSRRRPGVPPSRHGKLVKQNVPRTVSFESLSSTTKGPGSAFTPTTEPLSATLSKVSTDLDKPLPPPPRSESPTRMESMPAISTTFPEEVGTSLTPPHYPGRVTAKRSPPPVPTARRHGQGRSRSSTNDSSRSASLSEDISQYTHPSSPSTSSSTTASKPPPPPPPPPRRAGTAPAQENLYPASNLDMSMTGMEPPLLKPRLPGPLSRTPSTTSIKRISRISTASGSSGVAPPPPPAPRRRGSSQSQTSFPPSRLSGEYRMSSNERPRRDSGASSSHEPATHETQAKGKDLVADLATLQREVDELRGKFRG